MVQVIIIIIIIMQIGRKQQGNVLECSSLFCACIIICCVQSCVCFWPKIIVVGSYKACNFNAYDQKIESCKIFFT